MQRKPEQQEKEEKILPAVPMTGKKKEHGEQLVTKDQEESPDMVDEILGRRRNTRQQGKETQKEEESGDNKYNPSGNAKQKCETATADRERKKRVPPPPSARVDESKIDEEAVAKLEKTRLERLREEADKKEENKDDLEIAKPKKEEEERMPEQPLTPLLPREESPIGDRSTTEEMEDDKAEQCAAEERDARQTPPSQAWHRNTRPAEPKIPKQWKLEEPKPRLEGEQARIRLDQLAYLAMWMKEDDETRYFWEGRQPDQEAEIARLAREMQKTDQQLGQGATAQCIASKLREWGYEEPLGAPSQETAPETKKGEVHRYH